MKDLKFYLTLLISIFFISLISSVTAQVAINKDGSAANSSAMLQVKGDNNGTPVQALFIESATGNAGIGTTTPGFPLTFKDVLGDKISLFGQSGTSWGFGIQSQLLQIHGRTSNSNIVFGYGSSASFTELMRIKGNGQVGVGTSSPESSALFEVNSTSKGFLPPRMTTAQMDSISSPVEGLTVYNTDKHGLCYYNASQWKCLDENSLQSSLFICGNNYKVASSGYTFSTVKIGTQCWMAENLNVGSRINKSQNQTDNDTIEKYCYFNKESNCDIYGGLYLWNEMMQYDTTAGAQGICPDGWHIPTDDEWKTLEMYLGMSRQSADSINYRGTDEGGKLKETGLDHWYSPNTGATNSSGFTGLPGGLLYVEGVFGELCFTSNWWSSSQMMGTENVFVRYLRYAKSKVGRNFVLKEYGLSVRCIKD